MARIKKFRISSRDRMALHDPVDAALFAYEFDGRRLAVIESYGRETREFVGKPSQSIQLDEDSAKQLYDFLKKQFGFS